ncbi:hypothetical protein [Blastococcus deserti]|uniref:Uncharacterized protein n=1 Tax=Blastococcus deserti TaxID=2259033 RepID=A0ABW4X648_9ACTN
MTDLAQNLLDPAAEHPHHPALRMDDAVLRLTVEILRRAVQVPEQVGQR